MQQYDFSNIIESLKQINLNPVIYDVKSILETNLNVPIPANYIKSLEHFFYDQLENINSHKDLNTKLHRLLMMFVLIFNNKYTNDEQKIKENSLFKTSLQKMREFSEEVVKLTRAFNISQEDIIQFYGFNKGSESINNS